MVTLRYPVNFIYISQFYYYHSKDDKHMGLDLGWSSKYYGANQPIYAPADGTVVQVVDNDKTGKSWGNLVKIQHEKNLYTLMGHMKDGILVKKGQQVKQGQILGYMGNTGIARGNHCHYEVYNGGSSTSYRVDPLPITYVYPGQIVSDSSKDKVKYKEDIMPFKEGDYVWALEDIKLYTTVEYKESKYTLKKGEKAWVRRVLNNNVGLANPDTHEYFSSAWTNQLDKLTKDEPVEDWKKKYEEEVAKNKVLTDENTNLKNENASLKNKISKAIADLQ